MNELQPMHRCTDQQEKSSGSVDHFPDEIDHLESIKEKLCDALRDSNEDVERYNKEYLRSKQYLVDYFHEIDPQEIFQNELALKQIESTGIFAVQIREKIAKLLSSPYFARIDFRTDCDEEPSIYYIGRFAFADESKILIFDWRAPISSMFYDCELGKAYYDAPVGRIEGELTRKRQFKIKHGQMEYTLESSVNIQDDVLQRELSHTSDEKMKTIIATIQKEQNQIIRNEKADVIVIQGVAGSGKTSIALHRIAYLLYRYKDGISANNVVIISPNKVFADYISNVLPELGEQPIREMSFADIAEIQLDGIVKFEPARDPVETEDPEWAERERFKSSFEFVNKMDEYLEYAAAAYFEPTDYTFGRLKVTKEWILDRYNAYQKHPIKKRLYEVSEDIFGRFETENIRKEELPKQRTIFRHLKLMFKKKDTMALYKDFYQWLNMTEKLVFLDKNTLEWADVYPFMYFHAALEGLKENKLIRHLVIDEMQDYTPAQYAVINKLFLCKKTILGDFGQTINPYHLHSLDDFRKLYDSVQFAELNKSYRSTFEIITFAKKILSVAALEPIERHGKEPQVISCCDSEEEVKRIKEKIDSFQASENATLGIILKTSKQASALYQALCNDYDVNLLTSDSVAFANGVSITSIQMSKGLEFDEVIIPSANGETYYTDYDRNLLYIACTRAMHQLSLTYSGTATKLIGEPS
ncbi:UvrD-helicase domain-containing protein [Oscillospiraceae bacterium PP1C4]